jgi:hypothetical protein
MVKTEAGAGAVTKIPLAPPVVHPRNRLKAPAVCFERQTADDLTSFLT